jgi:hypothetical protein
MRVMTKVSRCVNVGRESYEPEERKRMMGVETVLHLNRDGIFLPSINFDN